MSKKFELTTETKLFLGRTLYRIRALIAFRGVEAGELGGWVEKEENLSQEDDAWVYGDARVYGNAWVYGNAEVTKPTHLFQIGTIGSRGGFTTFVRSKTKHILVACGCFRGTIAEFEARVKEVHAGTKHEKTYLAAIELAKLQIEDVEV